MKILGKFYRKNEWCCGETYESIEWYDTTTLKPSKEHLEGLWVEVLKDEMREERNETRSGRTG